MDNLNIIDDLYKCIDKLKEENSKLQFENDNLNDWTRSFESTRGHYANRDYTQRKRIVELERVVAAYKEWYNWHGGCSCDDIDMKVWKSGEIHEKMIEEIKIATKELEEDPNRLTICKTCKGYGWRDASKNAW